MSKAFSKGSAVICPFFMHSRQLLGSFLFCEIVPVQIEHSYTRTWFFPRLFSQTCLRSSLFSNSLWSSLFYLIWSILASMPRSFHGSWMSQQPDFVVFLAPWVPFLQSRKTWDSYQIKPTNLALPDNLHVILQLGGEKKPSKLCPGRKDRSLCPPSPLGKFLDHLATSGDGGSKQAVRTDAMAHSSPPCHKFVIS